MATKTSPDKDRIQQHYDDEFNRMAENHSSSTAGLAPDDLEKLENYANTGDENTRGDDKASDSEKARQKEESGAGWVNNVTGAGRGGEQKISGKMRGWRKKGPMTAIIALLFGGGAGFSIMIAPGIGIVQMKEIMGESLNDQLAAMDIRNDHMFRAKLKSLQGGFSICSEKVNMRCKFATLSNSRVKAMKAAGFKFEPAEPDRAFKRLKPTSITFPDGTKVTNPQQIKQHLANNPAAISDLHRGFMNPKFAGLYDKAATKIFGLFKADRSQKIKGTTQEAQDEAMQNAISSAEADVDAKPVQTDEEDREYVTDEDGTRIYKEDADNLPEGSQVDEGRFNEISEANRTHLTSIGDAADGARTSGRSAVGGVLKSGFKGLSIVGAADTACTVYNVARAVSAAAKATRALQLFQYALVFFNVADRIKAGEATPEEVTYVGDKLTAIDTNKTVEDESGILGAQTGTDSTVSNVETKEQPNPYYGYNAFDSPGYKVAAYNEAPVLTSRDIQYMVGGGFAGTLSKALDGILDAIPGANRKNVRKVCSVVQSWWARTAGLVAGIFAAAGSFGASTALSIGASVAIGFAMPFFEAALADIMAGKTVTPKTQGVDSGDGIFGGSGALYGGMAMGHGMTPANKGQIKKYTALSNEVKSKYVAVETYEARDTPFDINNQYSFLGSLARKVNPTILQANASVSAALINIPSILGTAVSGLVPNSGAETVFNEKRFEQCENDEGYNELGIDADVFCNVRYVGLGLDIEPDDAVKWMLDNGHIEDDENGTPKSDEYKDWIKYCTEREDGWGETSNDDDNSDKAIGKTCVTADKDDAQVEQLEYFSAYFMYAGLQDTEDNGYETGSGSGGGAQTSEATPEMCKTLAQGDLAQIACKAYQFDNYGYLWGGGHGGTAKKFMDDFRAGKAVAGQDAILDCSGLVRMAIYDAMGTDIGGMGTESYSGYSKFKQVPKDQAKAGDILYKPGHTEIIVKNDVSGKRYETFGAHTAKTAFPKQIGPSSYSYGSVSKVFRFQS